ncbi:hypothetical protein BSKO_08245 [Bryopsis sp. KO-2023]|nr:hypothetical protein BSKO_08245 [Bryopsis sp. KO-2023]
MNSNVPLSSTSDGSLKRAQLLNYRSKFWQLHVGPFAILYAWTAYLLAGELSGGNGERMPWLWLQLCGTAVIHILLMLFTHWSAGVRVAATCLPAKNVTTADAVLVQFNDYTMAKEVVLLSRRIVVENGREVEETGFEARKQRYIFNFQTATFEPLKYPTDKPLSWYTECTGYENVSSAADAIAQWGPNIFEVPLPLFSKLLQEQLLAPFFVFQVFCVSLWCMDEYWMYSIFTLFMLVFFECTVAGQRLRNVQHLRSLQSPKQPILVYRCNQWDRIPGEHLIPGDIIAIGRPLQGFDDRVVPADALLLAGSCIVDESVLTGESTPLWKSSVQSAIESELTEDTKLDLKRDKSHILFGGTKILQHTGDKSANIRTPDGGCLAVVIQTGFETAQGRLMRTILYATEHVTANNWETGLFILFLLFFAVTAAAYVLYHGLNDPTRSRFKLFLTCSMIITSVIPPELPMELSIAVNHSLMQLAKRRVFCTEPFRIPFAGKVDICCFDKTGTLTDDSLMLQGIVPVEGNSVGERVKPVADSSQEASRVMATCHSLVVLEGELVGDPLEKAAFEATKWSLSANSAASPKMKERASIAHRFHFSPHLKRMSVVTRIQSDQGEERAFVVTKGAPEVIGARLESKPANYDAGYKRHASQGGRVIALAYKVLDGDTEEGGMVLRGANREAAETGLTFAGFAVFQCPLKPESEGALRMLKNSSHQLVMITGDAPLTACHTASKVHITDRDVLILSTATTRPSDSELGLGAAVVDRNYEWISPDEKTVIPFSARRKDLLRVAANWDMCITGDALPYLMKRGVASFVIPMVQVFARVSPDHKELVVNTLRSQGRVTLMCGDGTNDVGGLKAAHVGVALLCPKQLIRDVKKKVAQKRAQLGKAGAGKGATSAGKPGMRKGIEGNSAQNLISELERQGRPVPATMRRVADMLEEMDDGMSNLVKPGDASMAAAFTAKQSSVMPCTDLIKQGRSTLVSTVQMFKILGLMSLSSAFSLSVMSLEGVKIGDVQATVTGLLSAAMFFFLSNSQPLSQLSAVRPHPNIFCFYVFLSVLGQFAMHLFFLVYMYFAALESMPAKENQTFEHDFKPNLVNTVCFLVNFIIQIITFSVNYAGYPFVAAINDNKPFHRSLVISGAFCFALLVDAVPGLVEMLEMVSIPLALRGKMCSLVVIDFAVTYGLERALRKLFPAPLPPEKGYMVHKKDLAKLDAEKKES